MTPANSQIWHVILQIHKARFVVSCLECRRTTFTTAHSKLVACGAEAASRDKELEADENQWSYVENFKMMHLHPAAILEKNSLPLKGFLRHLSSCISRFVDAMALIQNFLTTSIYRKSTQISYSTSMITLEDISASQLARIPSWN